MALVMAENEQPVFRDFLGLDRGVTSKQQQQQQQHQQAEECYTSAATTTTSDVVLRATSRSSVGFDSEGDVGTTRGSSETGGRFETSSAPGYVTPPFGLALPSSSDPGSVGWQRCNSTSSLQQQQPGMMRSAFCCKPDFDNSNSSKAVSNKKKREHGSGNGSRESSSLQERLQTSVEAIENCRPPPPTPKMPRINQENINVAAQKRYIPEVLPSIDDLRLSMQPSMQKPPRLSSVGPPWLQQQQQQPSSCKVPEAQASNRNAMKQQQSEVPRLLHSGNNNNSGSLLQVLTPLPPSLRISHLGACAEREESRAAAAAAAAVVVSRDNNTGMSPPIITRPAADEGSQTGLKGSSLLAGLINNNNSTPVVPAAGSSGPPPLPRRPVKPAPSGGSADSILPSTTRQGPPPATRQLLTIFYGGQAHVFDDVPSNKAEAILAMAGSHGKSWSSTYSPRPAASVPDSAQEGSLSALEKEKTVQSLRGGSVSGGRGLALSTDVQALLRGCVNTANGTGRPT